MSIKDKLICGIYALTALVAFPATWINNYLFMTQASDAAFLDFFQAAYVNAAAASLTNDLFLVALAACVFIVVEGQRVGVRYYWLYLLLSPIVAISVTFPLFLLARHLKLSKSQDTPGADETTQNFV